MVARPGVETVHLWQILESLGSENEDENEFLSARSLVLCFRFRPRLRAHVIYYFRLKTTNCAFFTLIFHLFSRKNIGATTAIMLYVNETLHEEDVLMIFDELEVQNSHL